MVITYVQGNKSTTHFVTSQGVTACGLVSTGPEWIAGKPHKTALMCAECLVHMKNTAHNIRCRYPGDEAIIQGVAAALRKLREDAGLTIEEAEAKYRHVDCTNAAKAMAIVIKEARIGLSLRELSDIAGVGIHRLKAIERAATIDFPITDFFRIAYALCIPAGDLMRQIEEREKALTAD